MSASVVAHHREITPLYLIDNGNRLPARKWLRLPREDDRVSPSRSLTLRRVLFQPAVLPLVAYFAYLDLFITPPPPPRFTYYLKIYFAGKRDKMLFISFDNIYDATL